MQTPAETDLFARARRWMNLLDKVDPRKVRSEGADDPADIGAYLGTQEAARLARKLKDDFGVTENSIATWLERYDYESPAGTPYTSGGVNHLLKGSVQAADVDIERASIHDAAGRPNTTLPRIAVATFGPDADRLLARAQRWGSGLQVPIGTVLPVTAQGQSSDPAIDLSIRTDLVNLLTICPVLTAVYVTSREALVEDPDDRTFILTLLEHHGVPVIVDDEPLSAAGPGQEAAPEITRANSAIRLHQQLRAHDRGTVQDPGLSLARARELAEMRRDRHLQRTLEVIARELNEEGIPTRRGNGQWWAASVKALLERGPR